MDPAPKRPERQNYYKLLGLTEGAAESDIERAYKKQRRLSHPDSKLPGSTPNQEKFKLLGVAYDTLTDADKRAEYDKSLDEIDQEWDSYTRDRMAWKERRGVRKQNQKDEQDKKRREKERRAQTRKRRERKDQARQKQAAQQQQKENRKMHRRQGRVSVFRIDASKLRHVLQTCHERRDQEARRKQKREQAEQERQEYEEAERQRRAFEARAQYARTQEERRMHHRDPSDITGSFTDEEDALRRRWLAAQEREREQAKRREAYNNAAAEERLRRAQINDNHSDSQHIKNEDDEVQPADIKAERTARLETKQRAAAEREKKVLDRARAERQHAAEECLRKAQYTEFNGFYKQEPESPAAKRYAPELSSRAKKALAREWVRRKQVEHKGKPAGPSHDIGMVDLGWEHVDVAQTCDLCCCKGPSKKLGMWRCPDGGTMVCRPCLNKLSTLV